VSIYNDYIFLNGKLFQFVDRKHTKFNSTKTTINRTLNNSGWVDTTGVAKNRWVFVLDQTSRVIDRLETIWDLNSSLSLIDWDGTTYSSVAITNEFEDSFNGDDNFTITLNLEEL
jgi:hypothetical protein